MPFDRRDNCGSIEWESEFILLDTKDSEEGWTILVYKLSGEEMARQGKLNPIIVDVQVPGFFEEPTFDEPEEANEWLTDYVQGKHLELDCLCYFDFRSLIEP